VYKFLGELINVDQAVRKGVDKIEFKLETLEVSVWDARGYILAEDIYASINQPPFHRSAVDGFAVKAEDTFGASPLNPITLRIKGSLKPGDKPGIKIDHGEAVEVSTGAPLPQGADSVIMVEDVDIVNNYIRVHKPVPKWANVSRLGEDYSRGDLLVSKNTVLKPHDLAIIASSGYKYVKVYRRLSVGILCSGDEVVEPGQPLSGGEVYNSTGVLIKNYLDEMPFIKTYYYGIVGDQKSLLRDFIEKLIGKHDLLITSGGAGVSGVDVLRDVVEELGEYVFRGVAMRPGRPTSLALINNKPVFMLSGYPVAAWTGLEALVKPIIYGSLGIEVPAKPIVKALLTRRTPNVIGYRSYIRVGIKRVDDKYYAEPYMLRGSGVLSSLVKTNGYIIIPEDLEGYEKDSIVDVYLYS